MLAVRVERPAPLEERLGDVVGQVGRDRPAALLVDQRDLVRRVPGRRARRASACSTSPGASRRSGASARVTDVVGEVRVDPAVDLGLRDALARGRSRAAPRARSPGRAAGRRPCADRARAATRSRCARPASTRARRGRRACACRRARRMSSGRAPASSSAALERIPARLEARPAVDQAVRRRRASSRYALTDGIDRVRAAAAAGTTARRRAGRRARGRRRARPGADPLGARPAPIRPRRTGRAAGACRACRSGGAAARR